MPILRNLVLAVVIGLIVALPLRAEPKEQPWQKLPLIKGDRPADGWVQIGYGRFVVDGDALRAEPDGRGMGLLVYKPQKFGNCQIKVVYRVEKPKSNSGVYVRLDDGILDWATKPSVAMKRDEKGKLSKEEIAKLQAAAEAEEGVWYAVHHGFEVQIQDVNDALHRTGAIYGLAKAAAVTKANANAWRTMIITLKGSTIAVAVDGTQLSSFDSNATDLPPRTKWTEPKRDAKRPEIGYIGLQSHDPGDVVWFSEVATQPLPSGQE
jgi:hypothetical protein